MKRLHNIMEIEREVNIKPDENEWGNNQVNCFINAMQYYSILKRVMQGTLYKKYIYRKCGMYFGDLVDNKWDWRLCFEKGTIANTEFNLKSTIISTV